MEDLAPIAKKNKFYLNIRLGKDLATQTELISQSTKALIASQLASPNAIIASQEGIIEEIGNLSNSKAEVSEGIQGLKAAFEFGISEVVWQIEQGRPELQNILNDIMAYLDDRGKELRHSAADAYGSGRLEEALAKLLESEKKNKYDFTVHISLGMLYLFQLLDRARAYKSFENALKYARAKSKYHASLSLLYLALIKKDLEQIEEAEKLTAEATELTPDLAEAWYQNSQYNGRLKNIQKCIQNLEIAVKLDRRYCLKANQDGMFDGVRSHVNVMFVRLRSEEAVKAAPLFDAIKQKHDRLLSVLRDISRDNIIDLSSIIGTANAIDQNYGKLNAKKARNSFFDFLDLNQALPLLMESQKSLVQEVRNQISRCLENRREIITVKRRKHESKRRSYAGRVEAMLLIGTFAVPVFGILFLFPDWSKLWLFLFCIPVVSQLYSLLLACNAVGRSHDALLGFGLQPNEQTLGWLLIVYFLSALLCFFFLRLTQKLQVVEELNDSRQSYEAASHHMREFEMIIDQ